MSASMKHTPEFTERAPVMVAVQPVAQPVGFIFAVAGTVGFAAGVPLLGVIATAFALIAAFGICLGCQTYPLVARLPCNPTPA
jgi:Domain of unknown function (DUF4395)